jgi:hypothetical protein
MSVEISVEKSFIIERSYSQEVVYSVEVSYTEEAVIVVVEDVIVDTTQVMGSDGKWTVIEQTTVVTQTMESMSQKVAYEVSVSYEQSIEIEQSVEIERTVEIQRSVVVLVVTIVQSMVYVPIDLPVFVTTMSRVELAMDRYTTAPPAVLDNATLIGVATGGAFIAAIMGGVVIFLVRRGKADEVDSEIDIDELNDSTVRSTRSRTALPMDKDSDDDFSGYDSSEGSDWGSGSDRDPEMDEALEALRINFSDVSSGDEFRVRRERVSSDESGEDDEESAGNHAPAANDDWDLWA